MPLPDYEYKAFAEATWLDDGPGGFEGYASLFNVPDLVHDVIRPGAFKKGLKRFLSEGFIAVNHQWHQLPVGYPTDAFEDDKGWFIRAQYHSTPEAQAVRRVAYERHLAGKPMGLSQGFSIGEGGAKQTRQGRELTEIHPHEVSLVNMPLLRPARISGVKSMDVDLEEKGAVGAHSTATSSGGWDGPANERRLSNDAGAATYRRAYAWGPDPDSDADTKAAWRFIHHEIGQGGNVGAANMRACSTGIGVLNGGRGGTTIPSGDRRGVYNHLARHLRDGDMEPPELRGAFLAELLAELKSAGVEDLREVLAELERVHADEHKAAALAQADEDRHKRFLNQRRAFRVATLHGGRV